MNDEITRKFEALRRRDRAAREKKDIPDIPKGVLPSLGAPATFDEPVKGPVHDLSGDLSDDELFAQSQVEEIPWNDLSFKEKAAAFKKEKEKFFDNPDPDMAGWERDRKIRDMYNKYKAEKNLDNRKRGILDNMGIFTLGNPNYPPRGFTPAEWKPLYEAYKARKR